MSRLNRFVRRFRNDQARHTIINVLVTYAGMALSLISAPILAQTLGADGRGVLAGVFVVIQVVGWIAFLGLPQGIALQLAKRAELSAWGILTITALGITSAAIVYLVAPNFAHGDSRVETGIRICSVVLVFMGFSSIGDQLSILNARVWVYNSIRAATLLFPSLAIIILFFLGFLNVTTAFLATLIGQSASVLIGTIVAIGALRHKNRARVPWSFSLRLWSSTIFDSVGGRGDQLALTALAPPAVIGVYAIAVTCTTAASGLAQAITQASINRFFRESRVGVVVPIRKLSLLLGLCTAVSGIVILIIVFFFGVSIFGPDFAGLAPVVAILVLAAVTQDLWKLRAARAATHERAGQLAIASAVGLATMGAAIGTFVALNIVSAISMAVAYLAMCSIRLVVFTILEESVRPRND